MSTTIQDLKRWFNDGVRGEHTRMLVVCDTFDHEDYPVYTDDDAHFWEQYDAHNDKNMQRIMEVYDLSKPWVDSAVRLWELPERTTEGKSEGQK